MMALYADGSLTTVSDTIRVFDFGSPPNVTGIVVAPKGETKSPVSPIKMLFASRLERNVKVFVVQRPLPDLGSRIRFSCRGAVTARGWPAEDDVDLLLNRAFGSG
ncbi:hypothetical protein BHE74_00056975 [Ensete ventricosum]|nr:hypothetical protein BHE74_00056975 [Ensete ventricosum]